MQNLPEQLLETLYKTAPVINRISEELPEYNSIFGVISTTPMNLELILQSIPKITQPFHEPLLLVFGIVATWNYLDALCCLYKGYYHLFIEKNKMKGILNIISGVVALTFTYNPSLEAFAGVGAFSFAAPAFAFMNLIEIVIICIDLYDLEQDSKKYLELKQKLQIKILNFIGFSLLAIAPFAGSGAPILFALGLIITLSIAGISFYSCLKNILCDLEKNLTETPGFQR